MAWVGKMTSDEYEDYLRRIAKLNLPPANAFQCQLAVSLVRCWESGHKMDRNWLESQIRKEIERENGSEKIQRGVGGKCDT